MKNIQWFHSHKCWNAILNSGLLPGSFHVLTLSRKCHVKDIWICHHKEPDILSGRFPKTSLSISSGFTLTNVEMPSWTAVSGLVAVIIWLYPNISSNIYNSPIVTDMARKCPNISWENIQWFHAYKCWNWLGSLNAYIVSFLPQIQRVNIPVSHLKYPVASHWQMFKHSLKQWSLAWQPSHWLSPHHVKLKWQV